MNKYDLTYLNCDEVRTELDEEDVPTLSKAKDKERM